MKRILSALIFIVCMIFPAAVYAQTSGNTPPPPPVCGSTNAGALYTNTGTSPATVYTCSYYNLAWQWVVNPSYGGLVSYPTVPTTCSGSLPVFLAGWPNTQMYVCVSGVPVSIGGYGSGVTNFSAPSGSWPSWLVPTVINPTTTPSLTVAAHVADASHDGYLSSTDWGTFNGKQAALTNPVTGPGSGATVGHMALMGNTSGTSITDGGAVPTLASLGGVPTSTTVNGHALSGNVTVSASDINTGTLPHAQLPTLLSGDIPNNAANTSGNAATATYAATAGSAPSPYPLSFGTHLQGTDSSYNGSAAKTISTDATSSNTASTIVARDASNNFAAGTITASLTGHASLDAALAGAAFTGPVSAPIVGGIYYAANYNFASQSPSGSISIGANTVTLAPCPAGVSGADALHYLYLAGTGTPEAVLITGGTCTGGATSGTVVFTAAGTHANGYTVASATGGLQETVVALNGHSGKIVLPASVNLYATFSMNGTVGVQLVGLGMGRGDEGVGTAQIGSLITWAGGNSATAIDISGSQYDVFQDFSVYVANTFSGITTFLAKGQPPLVSTGNVFTNVTETNYSANGIGMVLGNPALPSGGVLDTSQSDQLKLYHVKFQGISHTGGVGLDIRSTNAVVNRLFAVDFQGDGVSNGTSIGIRMLSGDINSYTSQFTSLHQAVSIQIPTTATPPNYTTVPAPTYGDLIFIGSHFEVCDYGIVTPSAGVLAAIGIPLQVDGIEAYATTNNDFDFESTDFNYDIENVYTNLPIILPVGVNNSGNPAQVVVRNVFGAYPYAFTNISGTQLNPTWGNWQLGNAAPQSIIPSGALPATVVQTNQANSYMTGMKQTVQASATTAGLAYGGVTADPSIPVIGDTDFRTDLGRQGVYTTAWHRVAYTDDTISADHGGTGTTNLSGIRKANGTSADTVASSAEIQAAIGSGVYASAAAVPATTAGDLLCAKGSDTTVASEAITGESQSGSGPYSVTVNITSPDYRAYILGTPIQIIGYNGVGGVNATGTVTAVAAGTSGSITFSTVTNLGTWTSGGTISLVCVNTSDATTAPTAFQTTTASLAMAAGTIYHVNALLTTITPDVQAKHNWNLYYGSNLIGTVQNTFAPLNTYTSPANLNWDVWGISSTQMGTYSGAVMGNWNSAVNPGYFDSAQPVISNSPQVFKVYWQFAKSGLATATYVSGGSFSGTGNCSLTTFNSGGGSTPTASIAVSSGTPGAITVTTPGYGFTAASTTAVAVTGTATCSGTITITSTLGGAPGNAVRLDALIVR